MASPVIRIKRSSQQNNAPTAAQLELGELALNTYDGKLFTEIHDGTTSIVEIGGHLRHLAVSGISTFTGLIDGNGGANIGNVNVGVTGSNEIDTSSGNLTIDSAGGTTTIDDALVVTGTISANGDVDLGDATTDTVSFVGRVDTNILPSVDNVRDLGSSDKEWRHLFVDGRTEIDNLNSVGIATFNNNAIHANVYSTGISTFGSSVNVTGNITVTGTVDGRDLASDGSKLDGIESGATADQTASEILTLIKTVDGAGSGLDADTLDGVQRSSLVRGDTVNNGALNINVQDADFIVEDNTDGTAHFIWRDHSVSKLYLGTPTAVITTRSDIRANLDSTYDIGSNSKRFANGYFDTLYGDGSNLTNLPSQTDQNFTNADHSKLDGIEAGATADQTASEILSLLSNQTITTTGDIKINNINKSLQVGDISNDNYVDLRQISGSSYVGLSFQHSNASVLQNLQGSTNQYLVLGDNDNGNGGTIFGIAQTQGGSTFNYLTLSAAGNLNISNNITLGGTVDGRDVASDGSKLDGIESGATADQTAAEIRTLVGSASDSNVFTDADHSKLDGIEAGADVTDATNVNAAGAVMNSDSTTASMSFVIDEDNMSSNSSTKVPTQQSVKAYVDSEVSGLVDSAPGALNTLNELAAAINDDASFSTTITNSIATKLPLGGGTMTGNIVMSGSQTVDGRDLSVDGSKLDGIESGATADQTASEILTLIKTVDGAGSGLDADTLDGVSSASFLRSDADDSFSGTIFANSDTSNPVLKIQGSGPNFIQFASDASGTVNADSINFIYRTTPNTLGFERASNAATLFSVDADNAQAIFSGNLDVGAGLDVTGSITVSGTVDGRDVASDGSKLDGIESGATADQTASEILTLIKTVDGAGSGLDADTLDGVSSGSFIRSDATDTVSGALTFTNNAKFTGIATFTNNAIHANVYSTGISTISGFRFPTTDGDEDQALVTDGNGSLSFKTLSGGGGGATGAATTISAGIQTATQGQTVFSTPHPHNDGTDTFSTQVFVNGLKFRPQGGGSTKDFTTSSNSTITMESGLNVGDEVVSVVYFGHTIDEEYFTATQGQVLFPLAGSLSAQKNFRVFVNGVKLRNGDDYGVAAPVTLTTPCAEGAQVEIVCDNAEDKFTATDQQTNFTPTSTDISSSNMQVYVNGLQLFKGIDFSIGSPSVTLTDAAGLTVGDHVDVCIRRTA